MLKSLLEVVYNIQIQVDNVSRDGNSKKESKVDARS